MKQCSKNIRKTMALVLAFLMVVSTVVFTCPMNSYAATKVTVSGHTKVEAGKTAVFQIKGLEKGQYATISFGGKAKTGLTVKYNKKTVKSGSTKIKGTGKTIKLNVTTAKKNVGQTFNFTLKVYSAKGKLVSTTKSKAVKVVVKATSVKLNQSTLSLKVGDSAKLKVTTKPVNATSAKTWKSSNKAVVTVDKKGKVTAVAAGTATITVTANGHKATCKVTVVEAATDEQQNTTESTESTDSNTQSTNTNTNTQNTNTNTNTQNSNTQNTTTTKPSSGGSSTGGTVSVPQVSAADQLATNIAKGGTVTLTENVDGDVTATYEGTEALIIDTQNYNVNGNVRIDAPNTATITIVDTVAGNDGAVINGNLTINAPKAHVENSAVVTGKTVIEAVSDSTYVVKDNAKTVEMAGAGTVKVDVDAQISEIPAIVVTTSAPVRIEGKANEVTIANPAANITVSADLQTIKVKSDGAVIVLNNNSSVKQVIVQGDVNKVTISGEGTVDTIDTTGTQNAVEVDINKTNVTYVAGDNATVNATDTNSPTVIEKEPTVEVGELQKVIDQTEASDNKTLVINQVYRVDAGEYINIPEGVTVEFAGNGGINLYNGASISVFGTLVTDDYRNRLKGCYEADEEYPAWYIFLDGGVWKDNGVSYQGNNITYNVLYNVVDNRTDIIWGVYDALQITGNYTMDYNLFDLDENGTVTVNSEKKLPCAYQESLYNAPSGTVITIDSVVEIKNNGKRFNIPEGITLRFTDNGYLNVQGDFVEINGTLDTTCITNINDRIKFTNDNKNIGYMDLVAGKWNAKEATYTLLNRKINDYVYYSMGLPNGDISWTVDAKLNIAPVSEAYQFNEGQFYLKDSGKVYVNNELRLSENSK